MLLSTTKKPPNLQRFMPKPEGYRHPKGSPARVPSPIDRCTSLPEPTAARSRKVGAPSRIRGPRAQSPFFQGEAPRRLATCPSLSHYPSSTSPIEKNEQSPRSVPGTGLARSCAVQHLAGAPEAQSWGFEASGVGKCGPGMAKAEPGPPPPPPASKVRKPPSPTRFHLCADSSSRCRVEALGWAP